MEALTHLPELYLFCASFFNAIFCHSQSKTSLLITIQISVGPPFILVPTVGLGYQMLGTPHDTDWSWMKSEVSVYGVTKIGISGWSSDNKWTSITSFLLRYSTICAAQTYCENKSIQIWFTWTLKEGFSLTQSLNHFTVVGNEGITALQANCLQMGLHFWEGSS